VVWSALDLGVANPGSARAAGALGSLVQGVGRRTGAGAEHRHRWQQHMERERRWALGLLEQKASKRTAGRQ